MKSTKVKRNGIAKGHREFFANKNFIRTSNEKPRNKELLPSGTFFTTIAFLEIFAALFFLFAAVGINAQWRRVLQE